MALRGDDRALQGEARIGPGRGVLGFADLDLCFGPVDSGETWAGVCVCRLFVERGDEGAPLSPPLR